MKSSSTISSKGQVTIPQPVRIRLGLRPGDRVDFLTQQGRTYLRPQRKRNSFNKYVGMLGVFPGGIRGIKGWVREMRHNDADDRP